MSNLVDLLIHFCNDLSVLLDGIISYLLWFCVKVLEKQGDIVRLISLVAQL